MIERINNSSAILHNRLFVREFPFWQHCGHKSARTWSKQQFVEQWLWTRRNQDVIRKSWAVYCTLKGSARNSWN